ncbi:DUF4367 domain-containing protein [Salipaludibacillus agaradhaerens]|uniref:outer membrane lipoprotein-sorting protein n=1 Tax=Salipaludibacillus agaradhaerens TaxID=76935 RepID=UPI002151440C|nr:DUF4367 domain-containing protein [Salipaludibacillus agaradhaerens]MCR6105181.1 DUF4367 domain-containing protein [Salipaludibacillus agaradhaerens]MCR6117226.1 DUF4367 domain-containing protein [Salipaludibacillus agaradhaerens]UJW56421.1 DUF4367 domain-containing protein [Bacillus sp. A116_S68]
MLKGLLPLVSGLSLVSTVVGCSLQNTEEIIENATQAYDNLESYYAEITHSYYIDGEKETVIYKEWNVAPDKHRIELRDGYTYVSNEDESWLYDKEENMITILDDQEDIMIGIPDESHVVNDILTAMLDSSDVVVEGNVTVAGRSTVHLSLTPHSSTLNSGSYDIWIDEETYIPLKIMWEEDSFRSETLFNLIDYNINVNNDLFRLDPPANAEIQTMEEYLSDSLTLEELEEKADYEIPQLTYVPSGYHFQEAKYFEAFRESMIEFRNNDDDYLILSVSETTRDIPDDGQHELLDIGRFIGTYSSIENTQLLSWNTGKLQLELIATGSDLNKKDVLKTAEHIN